VTRVSRVEVVILEVEEQAGIIDIF